jgi:3-hydroxy-9,10-secoandrosta-1,3,5(10)-triene-9,17-dione monooxygenase
MNTMTDNYLTPDALAVIERAKALAPKLAARAAGGSRRKDQRRNRSGDG